MKRGKIVLPAFLVVSLIVWFVWGSWLNKLGPQYLNYSTFKTKLAADEIDKIEIGDKTLTVWPKDDRLRAQGTRWEIEAVEDKGLVDLLDKKHVEYKQVRSWFWPLVADQGLLLIVLGVLIYQLLKKGKELLSFRQAKTSSVSAKKEKTTFADVAGINEAKNEVQEIVLFLKDPKRFTRLGGRLPSGILLTGEPGTGKTLLARAIAGEAGVPFMSISGASFIEMFAGVGASRVRDLFAQAKIQAPCIIFIDEIDAIGRRRGSGTTTSSGHDEQGQTLNQLLVEMDGCASDAGVIILAATNRPDALDPALLRPGRFDRRVEVPLPDVRGRLAILQVHAAKVTLNSQADLVLIARGTPGFSGAQLAALINEAALLAARRNRDSIETLELEEAKDKVLMGPERTSMIISEQEKRTVAYHEAGHTLAAKLLPNSDPVHKVTIIARGRAGGGTFQVPIEDRTLYTQTWLETKIAVLCGGRIGEELGCPSVSTGAGDDIRKATELAYRMVCEWGMSEELGFRRYDPTPRDAQSGTVVEHADSSANRIDEVVQKIIKEQMQRTLQILKENRPLLDRIAQALIERESLSGQELDQLLTEPSQSADA